MEQRRTTIEILSNPTYEEVQKHAPKAGDFPNRKENTPQKVAAAFFDSVNGGEYETGMALAMTLRQEHRTLQQCAMRSIRMMLLAMASDSIGTDLRNEQAHKFAKAAVEATKDIGLPLI